MHITIINFLKATMRIIMKKIVFLFFWYFFMEGQIIHSPYSLHKLLHSSICVLDLASVEKQFIASCVVLLWSNSGN